MLRGVDRDSFFENYYHFMEILDLSVLPDYYYNRSPLLFWCIISIAARRYDEDATLVANLSPCVTKLMWNTVSVRPHSRYTIQALLLISLWSFPTNTMATDQSFMMVSLAKCAAMQLGLHRPETVQDFLRVKTTFGPQEFQEAVKVWAGCFIVAQR
jgi:transcriptional regulatory protein LEU3